MTPLVSGEASGGSAGVPPGAALMVRVWFDEGDLRVRLTATDDLEGPAHTLGVGTRLVGVHRRLLRHAGHGISVPILPCP